MHNRFRKDKPFFISCTILPTPMEAETRHFRGNRAYSAPEEERHVLSKQVMNFLFSYGILRGLLNKAPIYPSRLVRHFCPINPFAR